MQERRVRGPMRNYPLYTCGNELLVFLRKADADLSDAHQAWAAFPPC